MPGEGQPGDAPRAAVPGVAVGAGVEVGRGVGLGVGCATIGVGDGLAVGAGVGSVVGSTLADGDGARDGRATTGGSNVTMGPAGESEGAAEGPCGGVEAVREAVGATEGSVEGPSTADAPGASDGDGSADAPGAVDPLPEFELAPGLVAVGGEAAPTPLAAGFGVTRSAVAVPAGRVPGT